MIFIVEINIPRVLSPNSDDWHDESLPGSCVCIYDYWLWWEGAEEGKKRKTRLKRLFCGAGPACMLLLAKLPLDIRPRFHSGHIRGFQGHSNRAVSLCLLPQ
jgi:hypothetical protein